MINLISVIDLNNKEFFINDGQIEKIEQIPETIITMMNGKKYIVSNNVDDIIKRIKDFRIVK